MYEIDSFQRAFCNNNKKAKAYTKPLVAPDHDQVQFSLLTFVEGSVDARCEAKKQWAVSAVALVQRGVFTCTTVICQMQVLFSASLPTYLRRKLRYIKCMQPKKLRPDSQCICSIPQPCTPG